MTFDLARAVKDGCRTRDGRPVRIICTDLKTPNESDRIVVARCVVTTGGGIQDYEETCVYRTDGLAHSNCRALDLVNLPEAHEVTVQLWKSRYGDFYLTAEKPNGMRIGEPLPVDCTSDWIEWGKPVTVRIEKDD